MMLTISAIFIGSFILRLIGNEKTDEQGYTLPFILNKKIFIYDRTMTKDQTPELHQDKYIRCNYEDYTKFFNESQNQETYCDECGLPISLEKRDTFTKIVKKLLNSPKASEQIWDKKFCHNECLQQHKYLLRLALKEYMEKMEMTNEE